MLTFHLDELDSTSEQAKRLAMRYPEQPLLVTAKRQTAGRGRSGRMWHSPVGGAWFSLVWPIANRIEHSSVMPLLVGWVVLKSIRAVIGSSHTLKMKWPNDVLLGDHDQKIAGVLCEQVLQKGYGGAGPALVVGVGINVNFDPSQLGDDLRCTATTLLSAIGKVIELPGFIGLCVHQMIAALDGSDYESLSATTLQDLEAHLAWINQPVSLRNGNQLIHGICRGLDPSGRIQIMVDQQLQLFDAGEVSRLSYQEGGAHSSTVDLKQGLSMPIG